MFVANGVTKDHNAGVMAKVQVKRPGNDLLLPQTKAVVKEDKVVVDFHSGTTIVAKQGIARRIVRNESVRKASL